MVSSHAEPWIKVDLGKEAEKCGRKTGIAYCCYGQSEQQTQQTAVRLSFASTQGDLLQDQLLQHSGSKSVIFFKFLQQVASL